MRSGRLILATCWAPTEGADMEFLTQLWLPILVSGVVVWIASFIAWMVIGHHKKDRDPIPGGGERAFMETITRMNIGPGNYGFPDFCQHDQLPRKTSP